MEKKAIVTLRAWATRASGVVEDVACQGTALESTTFKSGGKAFLFVQPKGGAYVVRLKLVDSLTEARRCGYEVGASGWVKLPVGPGAPPAILAAWIEESRVAVTEATRGKAAKKLEPKKKAKNS